MIELDILANKADQAVREAYVMGLEDGGTPDAPAASPWTLRDAAMVYEGLKEIPGERHHPVVVAMLHTFASWVYDDETAWCGAYVGFVCRSQGYPTPRQDSEPWRALTARYWLTVGEPVEIEDADENCIVVFSRGRGEQPGPDVLNAPGHVGFYAGGDSNFVRTLGGNQRNAVNVSHYEKASLLGVRRMVRR